MTNETSAVVALTDDQIMVAARAAGWDRLSEGQRNFAVELCRRYGLDPLMRHLVMIEGSPYITRDGLLHTAHRSGDFDGIEVTDPVLDEKPDARNRRFWRCRCKVWRKSFSRPFEYAGRYPDNGRNAAYAEEMAIKVAEVMTLRRAFDVSAPTVEERWAETDEFPAGPGAPAPSLSDRIAERAALIDDQDQSGEPEPGPEYPDALNANHFGDETSPPAPSDEELAVAAADAIVGAALQGIVEGIDELAEAAALDDETADALEAAWAPETEREPIPVAEGQVGAWDGEPAPDNDPAAEPIEVVDANGTIAEGPEQDEPIAFRLPAPVPLTAEAQAWAAWASPRREKVKAVVRERYPNIARLSQLSAEQMAEVKAAVDAEETASVKAVQAEREKPARPTRAPKPAPAAAAGPDARCGAVSPLSGDSCTLVPGHLGVHRHGLTESW